jgi:hypothetical protein
MSHADTLRIWVRGHYRLGGYGSQTPPVNRQEAIRAFDALVAENQRLRDAIEEYILWEPRKAGHAEAHRKLCAALDGTPSEDT